MAVSAKSVHSADGGVAGRNKGNTDAESDAWTDFVPVGRETESAVGAGHDDSRRFILIDSDSNALNGTLGSVTNDAGDGGGRFIRKRRKRRHNGRGGGAVADSVKYFKGVSISYSSNRIFRL